MNYLELKTGKTSLWIPDPKNWEELAHSVNEETGIMSYNPNNHDVDPTLVNMFL